jgi:hypothetical protein
VPWNCGSGEPSEAHFPEELLGSTGMKPFSRPSW